VSETEYEEIPDAVVRRVTPKAVMIESEEADVDEQWIPRSLIDWEASEAEPEEGSAGRLLVAAWFARKEGLV
jgi:hypothetical protein